ncbi:MAG: hypothetical protein OXF24_03315, partial [Hyphomicrobiales bacterium]|nr:hypothetical protein [Hyphomicrobiales bacterium]
STLGEQDTANVEVSVGSNLPSPITLNIATGGSARETRDYTISSPSNKRLVIPAGESSGTIVLAGVDDDDSPSTAETIELTISVDGNLPSGWTLGSQTTHTVTLQDDDRSVGFVLSESEVEEPDGSGTVSRQVAIRMTQTPSSTVTLDVMTSGTALSSDFSAGTRVTFSSSDSGNDLTKNIALTINGDDVAELDETIHLTLEDVGSSLTSGGNAFLYGTRTHTVTVPANDNAVSIDSSSADTLDENGGTADVVVGVNNPSPEPITLNVAATSSNGAVQGPSEDYTVPGTLVIDANSATGTLTLTGINDSTEEDAPLEIDLVLTGTLPDGWNFVDSSGNPANPAQLTHTVTIIDDEISRLGWVKTESEIDAPVSGGVNHTIMIRISRPTTSGILAGASYNMDDITEETEGGIGNSDFSYNAGSGSSCTSIQFRVNESTTVSCTLRFFPMAAGKTLELTITESASDTQIADAGFTIDPAVHTITINGPPELGFAETTDTVDAPTTANRIHDVTIGINRDTSSAIPFIVEVTGGTKASVGVGGDWSYASQRGCDEASFAANGGRTVTCRLVIFPMAAGKTLTLTIKEAASSTAIADAGFTINPATQMLTVN